MAASTVKRVLLYRFDRQPVEAIVSPATYLRQGHVELMTSAGSLQAVPYGEVKALCFASEPGRPDLFTDANQFERRPKTPGLWARFTFRDGDKLEGILSHNLLEWPESGYMLTPPRSGASRQRVFLPREALLSTEFLGVVGLAGAPVGSRAKSRPAGTADQLKMFDQ